VETDTEAYVQSLMPVVGLKPSRLTVTVTTTSLNGVQGEVVAISNQFPLFGQGIFPTEIQLSDTEFASASIQ
jgi:hypothetical protein